MAHTMIGSMITVNIRPGKISASAGLELIAHINVNIIRASQSTTAVRASTRLIFFI